MTSPSRTRTADAAPQASPLHPPSPATSASQHGAEIIQRAEQVVYAIIGGMLVVALLIALAGAGELMWTGMQDWTGTDSIVHVIDRLLFVLMLVEILHTVHASLRAGTLVCEPFLIVGLIACIRRILVITLETSRITQPGHWTNENLPLFHASMLELAVLALLIVVLVGSILVTRTGMRKMRATPSKADARA